MRSYGEGFSQHGYASTADARSVVHPSPACFAFPSLRLAAHHCPFLQNGRPKKKKPRPTAAQHCAQAGRHAFRGSGTRGRQRLSPLLRPGLNPTFGDEEEQRPGEEEPSHIPIPVKVRTESITGREISPSAQSTQILAPIKRRTSGDSTVTKRGRMVALTL